MRFRVVADHVRSSMMLIGDGVTPGNEGRGYVLRRLLRRAVRSMRLLGYEDRVLPELLPVSRDKMGETYDELHRDWERISQIAYAEEDAFRQTLRAGTTIFDQAAAEVQARGRHRAERGARLRAARHLRVPDRPDPGDGAGAGALVDEVGFRELMGQQRDRAKADARAKKGAHVDATAYRQVADSLGRPGGVHRLPRGGLRGLGARPGRRPAGSSTPRARATRSSWSSTARRSTPRAAASWPTRA